MTPGQGWVQPPGTPAVGLAMLQAYAATEDALSSGRRRSRARARQTQLESGGWHAMIEFDPEPRKAWCYRRLPEDQSVPQRGRKTSCAMPPRSTTTSPRARSSS